MLARREKLSSILASTAVQRHQSSLVACSSCLFVVMGGGTYCTATKEPISDEGLQVVEGRAHGDGPTLVRRFRVASVSRTLMPLSQMVEQGIKVVFDSTAGQDSSHMVIKKCEVKIPMVKKNKVYVLPWHVTSDFSRRGQNL